jgi:hypothetical protein
MELHREELSSRDTRDIARQLPQERAATRESCNKRELHLEMQDRERQEGGVYIKSVSVI